MTAQIIPFPKVNKRTGESPLLSDCAGAFERYQEARRAMEQAKREPLTDKIRQTMATIWKPGGAA